MTLRKFENHLLEAAWIVGIGHFLVVLTAWLAGGPVVAALTSMIYVPGALLACAVDYASYRNKNEKEFA